MKKLIVLSGVPGSGKSYFCSHFKKALNGHVYIVSSDEIRTNVTGQRQDMSQDDVVWKVYYDTAAVYACDKNATVLLDATHSNTRYRTQEVKNIKHLFDETDLVCFHRETERVLKQNAERDYPIPEKDLIWLIEHFENPTDEDKAFFDHIWMIEDGEVDETVKEILK